ncbi:MAG TPA: hypothetical protein VN538_13720 [Clostridia bacterium]|nr:hypothetical protein [Clostridia bacterium]
MMFTRGFGGFGMFCRGLGLVHPGILMALAALFLAALVVVIVLSVKKSHKGANSAAAEVLKLRYIKGELTEEEYRKMKDVLGK